MKTLLAFVAGMAAIVSNAQPLAPANPAAPSLQSASAQKTVLPSSVPSRQLSAEERAQLRRQLSDYSRVAGKGS
jgi:hypothetical protein